LKLEMPPEAGALPTPQAAPPAQQGGFDMPQVNYRLNIGGLKIKAAPVAASTASTSPGRSRTRR
jgi:hypothetical protein